MIRQNYSASYKEISRKRNTGSTCREIWAVSDDLGTGLTGEILQAERNPYTSVIELNCPENSVCTGYSPVKDLIGLTGEMQGTGSLIGTIDSFCMDAANGKFRGLFLIFRNTQNLSLREFDSLTYLLMQLRETPVSIIVSYRKAIPGGTSEKEFSNLAAVAEYSIKELLPMNNDEFEFLMGKLHYKFPYPFILNLYSISAGNIDILRYILAYYRNSGVIRSNGQVDETVYRYLPIPPPIEDNFRAILSSAEPRVRNLLYLTATLGTPGRSELRQILGMDEDLFEQAISGLVQLGLIVDHYGVLRISMHRVHDAITSLSTEREKKAAETVIYNSPFFEQIPFNLRASILAGLGKTDEAVEILRDHATDIVAELQNRERLSLFIEHIRRGSIDESLELVLRLLSCEAYFRNGSYDEALSCYLSEDFTGVDPLSPLLRVAEINRRNNNWQGALDILHRSGLEVSDKAEIAVPVLMSLADSYAAKGDNDKSREYTSRVVNLFDSDGTKNQRARAYFDLARDSISEKRLEDAIAYLTNADRLCSGVKDMELSLMIASGFGTVLSERGRYEEAVSRFSEIIENSYYIGDRVNRAHAYFKLLQVYEIMGNHLQFGRHFSGAEFAIDYIRDLPLSYEFHRLLAFHYINDTDYGNALAEVGECTAIAARLGVKQWIEMSEGLREIVTSFKDGVPRLDNWTLLSKEYEKPEDIMPFYLSNSLIYFMLLNKSDMYSRSLRSLESYNERSGEFFGIACHAISTASKVLFTEDFDEFRNLAGSLDETYDSVAIYRAFRKMFRFIANYDLSSKSEFGEEFKRLETEFRSSYPKIIRVVAVTFRCLLELRLFGESGFVSERLSNGDEFSPLVTKILTEAYSNGG